jgi:hypothetical protein
VVEFFAAGSVDALEQGGDKAFLDGEFGLECGDFGSEFRDLLFGCLDGFPTSNRRAIM